MKSRLELPKILQPQGFGVELGVAAGYYSEIILRNSELACLYSIDRWSDHHDEREFQQAKTRLAPYGARSFIWHMSFAQALPDFKDGFFDFIYVDAYAHKGQEDGQIMRDWWPKLKIGGIMAGHDYNSKFTATIKAVDEFCESIKEVPIIIPGDYDTINDQDEYESWWIVKT